MLLNLLQCLCVCRAFNLSTENVNKPAFETQYFLLHQAFCCLIILLANKRSALCVAVYTLIDDHTLVVFHPLRGRINVFAL
ncbi:hypothetical protein [Chitinibacter sp. GC72]|uniref:hypothetical protein n=1 Tax=Chitinibacter sp. GC72 TaxID=1526917 RepID=UPI0012FCCDC5|nr:hypothetical protein [Chitinibacter sp. GC72]